MSNVVKVVSNVTDGGTSLPPVTIDGNYIAAGSTKTLQTLRDNHGLVKLDTASGSVVTLPAASGSGTKFKFVVSTLATSSSHIIKVANNSDAMIGIISLEDTTASPTANAVVAFAANATSDTITMNRSTTGSVSLGEWVEAEDIATNVWHVRGMLSATGTPATPFSATV